MKDILVSIKTAAQMLGIHQQTLREWDENGKLVAERTEGGHRRYWLSQITSLTNEEVEKSLTITFSSRLPQLLGKKLFQSCIRDRAEAMAARYMDNK